MVGLNNNQGINNEKTFIFLALAAAGYLVYDNFVKDKEVIHVEGSLARAQVLKHLVLLQEIMDI